MYNTLTTNELSGSGNFYLHTNVAGSRGVKFNPIESVAIDIAYEGSGSGDWRTDGFIVGVG
ncbi:Ail/Lom family outer membrane beta-barrel protein, partial [Escherichia coli]|nr:Ail/Lom family outer membrane beta-barrel protein [Escherichia coli]